MDPDNEQLVTAREIAARYGVRVETVNRWTREKRIPCERPSRRTVRYSLPAVVEAMSPRRTGEKSTTSKAG